MNIGNFDWAIQQLDHFLSLTASNSVSDLIVRDAMSAPGAFGQTSDLSISAQAIVVRLILNRVFRNWREEVEEPSSWDSWAHLREAAIQARELLSRHEEIESNLGDDTPRLKASELHPWIWSGAESLWQSKHFRSAVEDAVKKVNAETQNKIGRRDLSETKLFQESFSLDPVKPGKARLRRMPAEDSDTYRSVQRGAMALAEGIFAGIRNPLSHEAGDELDEQVALEYLAALSVLARWVDESKVERVEEAQ